MDINTLITVGPILVSLAGAYYGIIRKLDKIESRMDGFVENNTREHDSLVRATEKLQDEFHEFDKQNALEHAELRRN